MHNIPASFNYPRHLPIRYCVEAYRSGSGGGSGGVCQYCTVGALIEAGDLSYICHPGVNLAHREPEEPHSTHTHTHTSSGSAAQQSLEVSSSCCV